MQMFNAEHLQEKWAPILDHDGLDPIKDSHRRAVTAILLENQEKAVQEEREFLSEQPTVNTGSTSSTAGFSADASSPVAGFDPVLISLIRRSMPNLVAYDLAGVQPMNGPTGLIFAMRSKFQSMGGSEALFDEADTSFSGQTQVSTSKELVTYLVVVEKQLVSVQLDLHLLQTQVFLTQRVHRQQLLILLVRVWVLLSLKI